jgi:glycosyltransferase involved in cell wall biosynthesis
MHYFDCVDQFVSPSKFLRQRYIEWGLPSEKIVVIENGQSEEPPLPPRELEEGEARNRFGFFGQINPYKGLDVLLEAINLMSKAERKKIVLEIHGANLEMQTKEYQEKIQRLLKPLIKQGVVQWIGPYQPHELRSRMANIDWVCVPSIWWENSPMIIQEAFACGRPLLVSDIGGSKEKVMHGINGFHINVMNTHNWQSALRHASLNAQTFDSMVSKIQKPISYLAVADKHLNN